MVYRILTSLHTKIRANIFTGNAPDAIRDQVMRHDPRWTTFFGAYLDMNVIWDLVGASLEEQLQNKLIEAYAHGGLTRDPRVTRHMVPDEVWEDMKPDPEIEELERRRQQLKGGQYRIAGQDCEKEVRELTYQIGVKKDKRTKDVEKEYRRYVFHNRPNWDIEDQFSGKAVNVEEEYVPPDINLQIPERAQLAHILRNQPSDLSDEAINELRIEVAALSSKLCKKREKPRLGHRKQQPLQTASVQWSEPEPFPLLMKNTQCPECFADEALTLQQRQFEYCRRSVMWDHFDDDHLDRKEQAATRGDRRLCRHPECKTVELQHVDHYRSHTESIHKVRLRSAGETERRRVRKLKARKSRLRAASGIS